MKNSKILHLIIIVALVGGAFFGGMQYQKSQRTVRNGQFAGQFAGRAGQQGGRPVSGTIISSDDASVTVKLQDGSTKIVLLSGSTVVNKQAVGSKTDLTTGARVLVIGKENSDGSVTADSVSLNPMFRGNEVTPTPAK